MKIKLKREPKTKTKLLWLGAEGKGEKGQFLDHEYTYRKHIENDATTQQITNINTSGNTQTNTCVRLMRIAHR